MLRLCILFIKTIGAPELVIFFFFSALLYLATLVLHGSYCVCVRFYL